MPLRGYGVQDSMLASFSQTGVYVMTVMSALGHKRTFALQ